MNPLLIVLVLLTAIVFIVWLGLRVTPKPFQQPALARGDVKTMPLPEGLPAPVERFYHCFYANPVPVIDSVVITGRGRLRPFGIWLPTRFVMTHQAGKNYRHYFEATFFGIPFLKIQEGYIDGESFFESPMATYYNDPNTNQGANLALWAEGAWFPSLWLTDRRARWQAVDDHTAVLFVPYEDGEENFAVRFDPRSGLVERMEAMRFRSRGDQDKILWLTNEVRREGQPSVSYATWLDMGKPWASFILEEVRFNLDVDEYIRGRGA